MNDRSPITEDELHAYIDGELPADRIAALEAWLASHPEDMAKIAAWRAQIDAIRTRYGAVADEAVPARFDLDRLMSSDRSWLRTAAAAAVATFLVGGAGGWFAHGGFDRMTGASAKGFEAFTSDAVEAYRLYVVEVRHPVEVPAADAEHLVQWLSKRVGYQLSAPDLEKVGLKLVGGRLLPGPTGAAAFFMYESASGERYTLYCGRSTAPETALRFTDNGPAKAIYWVNDEVAYVISGQGRAQRRRRGLRTARQAHAAAEKRRLIFLTPCADRKVFRRATCASALPARGSLFSGRAIRTVTSRSPWPPLCGMPLPLRRNTRPLDVPAGMASDTRAVERRHAHLAAEHRFVQRHRQFQPKVVAFAFEICIRRDSHGDDGVAGPPVSPGGPAPSGGSAGRRRCRPEF